MRTVSFVAPQVEVDTTLSFTFMVSDGITGASDAMNVLVLDAGEVNPAGLEFEN